MIPAADTASLAWGPAFDVARGLGGPESLHPAGVGSGSAKRQMPKKMAMAQSFW